MTNVQNLVEIANEIYVNAGGKERPYTLTNGKWFWNGEELDKNSQGALTTAAGTILAQKLLEQTVVA
jgi:hypothetical protein